MHTSSRAAPASSPSQSATLSLRALARAASLVADALPEERVISLLTRCAAETVGADLSAVYVLAEQTSACGVSSPQPEWRLGGFFGADEEVLGALPNRYGRGAGILAPLFAQARELCEPDLLDGVPHGSWPIQLPMRTILGLPVSRRDGRPIAILLVGAERPNAFAKDGLAAVRSVAHLVGIGIDNARLVAGQLGERRMTAESAVTLGTVLESVGSGVCVIELDGTLRVANKTLQDLFGLRGQMIGTRQQLAFAAATVKARDEVAFQQRLEELIATPSQIDVSEWDLATDPPRIVQRYAAPMRSRQGEIVGRVEVYTDITESRRLYTQLLNSEKLRAIGEMAAGVAHDFNNLLASIVGQTELLTADELPPTTRQAIATIRQAASDGASLVRNLQGLARPRAETPSTAADLNDTVQLAMDMARPRWAGSPLNGNKRITVALDLAYPKGGARVAIDPSELREVLLNLLFNAADAMPDGGSLHISTRPGRKPATAQLEVRDTGQGMPEAVRLRVFEPFFSTKGPKGSGLGLAVAYSIITRRGGDIEVESCVSRGTTFTISLPYASFPPRPPEPATQGRPSSARQITQPAAARAAASAALKGVRILVADDEPGLVTIVRQLMERSGARVSIANGGRAALDAALATDSVFDVVITDLDMPEVDGWAVAAAVKAHRPGTHVVMLTGWGGEIAPEDFRSRGVDVVLSKPCSRADLESAIGDLLVPKPATGLEVLLVDDQAAFARAIRDLLTLQGHHVTVVDSATKALAEVDNGSFDVVLTDYNLGQITGAQLAEQLADRPTKPFVVLVTGYATEIDDPSLLTAGVNAVLPKPCRGDDLRQVLARVRAARSS